VEHQGLTPATAQDVHDAARGMPHVTVERGGGDNPVYQVGRKSFVYFRTPRPDAVDPATGERYDDVIIIWVASEHDKHALVAEAWLSRASRRRANAWLAARGLPPID
jgi:hypothetical protein